MFPNQENTFLFLFLYLCYREDRMRLGIAKLEKLRFSFVSALAFRYLCTRYETEAYFFLYICLCMVFPAIAQMPVGNPIYGTDAYGNPVDANGNPVQLDANGNPVVDGYGNDAYTWGRDTTQAEEKIIPIGSYAWNIDERFGNITPVDVDTLPNNFQNFNLTAGPTGQYNFLGNLGSPRLSRLFMDRKPYSNFIFADPFDYFYTPVNEFQFTNTLSPITNLSYHSCGNKQDGEDRLRAYFASNINKISGIGFKLDYLYGRGYYNNQATSLFNGSLYGYYLDDRYNMHAWISVNHMRMGENGGIENDDYITHPEDFTRSYGSRDIPTILSENWNRNEDQTYYLTHRYNLGFYKGIELPDSLRPVMPADSVLLKRTARQLAHRIPKRRTRHTNMPSWIRCATISWLNRTIRKTSYRLPASSIPCASETPSTRCIHTIRPTTIMPTCFMATPTI